MISLLLAIIYICFVSLGLPDSLLGSGWPMIYQEFNVPVSYMGFVSMTISAGTITSSLFSDRITKKFGPGLVTGCSIVLTVLGMLGFYFSKAYWMLFLFAVPYGLGAGSIDAALNNYVALHFKSKHMSWLHCMWGIGAAISPNIMSFAIGRLSSWHNGYLIVAIIQSVIALTVFLSLPLWKKMDSPKESGGIQAQEKAKPITFKEIFLTPGALAMFIAFFAYCAYEQTCMAWASSYFFKHVGVSEAEAATCGSLFLLGMTLGRAINGFLAMKFSDKALIRVGSIVAFVGVILLCVPNITWLAMASYAVIGFGSGPIYPSIIHSTPALFGKEKSQAIIGMQMAFAYVGSLVIPFLFGLAANQFGFYLLPFTVIALMVIMTICHEILRKKARVQSETN